MQICKLPNVELGLRLGFGTWVRVRIKVRLEIVQIFKSCGIAVSSFVL